MFEFVGSAAFGGIMGGVFRLMPEVLKWLDRKDERAHELAMFERQVDLELKRGRMKLDEIGAVRDMGNDAGIIDAFRAAIDQQAEMVKVAGRWMAALSASVRPVLTYYLLGCYGVVKVCLVWGAHASGVPLIQAIPAVYGNEDVAMLAGVVNYWMLDRSLHKRGL